ncbi:DUF3987 domain-containing protein [Thiomicrospira sp. ALE5]|uniref:DUF3987 domain-containing protein n=1 Tax=Thiomicrospira sp. ALE5 TaxID=748650 RepID=UPI0008F2DA20|nr:DUF3987 domain-containing protein [Thiomicrospira sp. ALE5]SFR50837.1 Bifunctional DNA primase/polymerase, N-terminal [Thiomicrospira sp. ALE5]
MAVSKEIIEQTQKAIEAGFSLTTVTGKRPTKKDWVNNPMRSAASYNRNHTGFGIICGKEISPGEFIHLIDVDARNKGLCDAYTGWLRRNYPEHANSFLYRVGLAPKVGIPFLSKAPMSKLKSKDFYPADDKDEKNQLEILGDGQQFVAAGIHPDTGEPYAWTPKPVWEVDSFDLPLFSQADALKMIQAFEELAVEHGLNLKGDDLLKKAESAKTAPARISFGAGIIEKIKEAYDTVSIIEANGYEFKGMRGDKRVYLHPNSSTKEPGIVVFADGRYYSHHASDPLNDGFAHDVVDLIVHYRFNGNLKEAIKTLANELDPEGQKERQRQHREAEAQKLLDSLPTDTKDEKSYLPDFSPHIMHLPGLLGEMQEYIYGRMIYPCRAMAAVSAMAFIAHYAQNKAYLNSLQGKLSLNEYWLVMAKTGYGKESLISSFTHLDELLTGRFNLSIRPGIQQATPASPQGLHKLLEANNAQTFFSDEFAEWLIQASKGGDSHKQGTMGYLMQIYTKGFKKVNVPNAVMNKYEAVQNPRVTIFATTTGERLTEALTGSQADAGGYNRFIMFVGNPERIEKRYSGFKWQPTESLLVGIERILKIADEPIQLSDEARQYYIEFDSQTIEPLKFADPHLAGRLSEQALKLAGLIALANNRMEVLKDDLVQAYEIRLNLYERAKAYIDHEGGLGGDDPTVQAYDQVADLLTRKRQIRLSELKKFSRKYKKLKLFEQEQVLKALQRDGLAQEVRVKGGTVLIHVDDIPAK